MTEKTEPGNIPRTRIDNIYHEYATRYQVPEELVWLGEQIKEAI